MVEPSKLSFDALPHADNNDDNCLQLLVKQQEQAEAPLLLDSLPYIDSFPEEYESYALTLIEEEMKSMGEPATPYLPTSPIVTTSEPPRLLKGPLSRVEYARLVERGGQPRPASESFGLNTNRNSKRLGAGTLAPLQPPDQSLWNDEHAWKKSLRSAKIEFERQRLRQLNLELQQYYEPDQWRLYISQLSKQEERMNQLADQQQLLVDAINLERKDLQEGNANKFIRLSQQLNELNERNHRLHLAIAELDQEVKPLQQN